MTSNDRSTDTKIHVTPPAGAGAGAAPPAGMHILGPLNAPIPRFYFDKPKKWWARASDYYRNLPISALWALGAAAIMFLSVLFVWLLAPAHKARLGEYARVTTENPLAVRSFIFEREWPVAPPFLEIDDKISADALELLVAVNLEYLSNMSASAAAAAEAGSNEESERRVAPVCVFPSAYTHPWALVSTEHVTYVNPEWTGVGDVTIAMMTSLTGNSTRIAFLYNEILLVWKYAYLRNGEGKPYLAEYGGEGTPTRLKGALAHCIQTYYIK
jgi:hypothetical protein